MRCKDMLGGIRGYLFKRSHLVALRRTQDFGERSALSTWWPVRAIKCLGP